MNFENRREEGIEQKERPQGFETVQVKRHAVHNKENRCAPVQIRVNMIALNLDICAEIEQANAD